MHRRRFLRLSGLSATALFFSRVHPETGLADRVLHFPTAVAVLSEGEWISLVGSRERWTFKQLVVNLGYEKDAMQIRLQAPGMAIEKIRLSWNQGFAGPARYLGDHWERSYGDLSWTEASPSLKAPWYLLVNDGKQTHAFGVRTGARSMCYWQVGSQQLELYLDMHSGGLGVQLGDRMLDAAVIVTTQSLPGETPFQTDSRFCKMMCEKPRLPAKPVYGINDWYFAYGNNSKELILDSTRAMAELAQDANNRPFSVIDDGWSYKFPKDANALCWGDDYSKPNSKFVDMSVVAEEIKKAGMRPGLWTRPLLANNNDKPTSLIPLRNGEKDGHERYLDPTLPENLQRIGDIIGGYKQWGYELVKHDYTTYDSFGRWGFQMKDEMTVSGWHFHDRSRTNAEILRDLYATIRQAAGEMYLIGCNTVSHLSAGVFELNRIGDDTSGKEWSRTLNMGVNTMGFRLPQHNAFYAVDGDCVGLTTQIPWAKNKQWLQLLAESGAPLFISAQKEATGEEQKDYIRQCFGMAARVQPTGEPLDWMTNPHPGMWRLNGRVVEFRWEA